jgi:predicted RNA-binding Zn-ribbon protein involved in translation (DUF1610 family)
MMLTEKAAYVKGLAEGLGFDEETKEGKIIKAMIDLLDDIALSVADLEDGFDELSEQVDIIDEDLGNVEEDLYGDEDEDEDDEDEELYEVECPNCGDTIYLDEDMIQEEKMECPNCGELLEFDFEGCDECGCGCHDHESDEEK